MNFEAVDAEDLASCVSCGLCLPHCPTYRITGDDSHSPRGRIGLVAAVRSGDIALDDGVREALESCVQCMGCLPACPSSVRYDRIITPVIDDLAAKSGRKSLIKRLFFAPLTRPRLLRAVTVVANVAGRVHLMPKRFPVPPVGSTSRRLRLPATATKPRGDVVLFRGCVMDAWYPQVHQATIDVLDHLGYNVELSNPSLCCGALHAHAGLATRASTLTSRVGEAFPGATLVVNSAGCGAHLARHAENMGEVVDVMELVSRHLDDETLAPATNAKDAVVVHDACHLRNIQGTHLAAHRVLGRFYEVRPIPDEGLCCGAGGAYAIEHPKAAALIVERKNKAIQSVIDDKVRYLASGNPGCAGHLQSHRPDSWGSVEIVHPIELVARALSTSHPRAGKTGRK